MSTVLSNFSLKPIFASSIITITASGHFLQHLTYDYLDNTGKYYERIQDDDFYLDELETITWNMQAFMEDLPNTINGHIVIPQVVHAEIDFKNITLPFFYWVLEFDGPLKQGLNIYESVMSTETLEYDVNSIYLFDVSLKPRSIQSSLHYELLHKERIVKYWAYRGEIVGPKEVLQFEKEK
ncbi:MAG: hypothetical protein EU530_05780 [Promethearchaeota archaeon]|nr:MAG: hypothetical protein EU530_05780 [Candidatus Lokiarchaeota archaeon]